LGVLLTHKLTSGSSFNLFGPCGSVITTFYCSVSHLLIIISVRLTIELSGVILSWLSALTRIV
jgi:hypothetical protein